jgi:hypothetical protein
MHQTEQGVLVPGVTVKELFVALDLAMAMWRTYPGYLGPDDPQALLRVKAALDEADAETTNGLEVGSGRHA